MTTNKISYPFTRDYRKHWKDIDGIREVVQNAQDYDDKFLAEIRNGLVVVTSSGGILKPINFTLGHSAKGESHAGGFGEGLKIAMLILSARGYSPTVFSGYNTYTGGFEYNEQLEAETFYIEITKSKEYLEGVEFVCAKKELDEEELKLRLPCFDGYKGFNRLGGEKCVLLKEPKFAGRLYVNNIYVCKTSSSYGYNFSSTECKTNTDRTTVEGVGWLMAEYWSTSKDYSTIFDLLITDACDVGHLGWVHMGDELKIELAKKFRGKYGENVTVSHYGCVSGGVSMGQSAQRAFTAAGIKETKKLLADSHPSRVLAKFLQEYGGSMRHKGREELKRIAAKAKSWKE